MMLKMIHSIRNSFRGGKFTPEGIPKRIWMYWHQGWDHAPEVVRNCCESWRRNNHDWDILLLDKSSCGPWCKLPDFVCQEGFPLAALSDILRCQLLSKHGGVWADATTWNSIGLDEWLSSVSGSGFFAFDKPGPGRPLSSWFIVSRPNHYIIRKWQSKVSSLWEDSDFMDENRSHWDHWTPELDNTYFWFHCLFQDLLNENPKARKLWAETPKISADRPHHLLFAGLSNDASEEIIDYIDNRRSPVYKLTYRLEDGALLNERSILSYLFKS